jgi:hypothetical protein
MYRAYFNGEYFNIISLPIISDSSRETSFSELEIDFRGKTDADIPVQFQEIKIYRDAIHMASGYVDSIDFPEFRFEDQPFKLRISLLSPYTFASKRTLSIIVDTEPLNTAIVDILQPLIDDGFTIEENTLSVKNVSEIFRAETVEKILNYLGNKFYFIWYIDKDKKIYLKDIDTLVGQIPVANITDTNKCYLQSIKPTKTVVDYANKLVVKNAILIGGEELLPTGTVLVNGATYNFKYPLSISENTGYRIEPFTDIVDYNYSFWLLTNITTYEIIIDLTLKTITFDAQIGFLGTDDNSGKKILLQRDPFDITKITGFKWNAASETVGNLGGVGAITNTALLPIVFTFIDPYQVNLIKTKTLTSGIVEKTVDANGKYFTYDELVDYVGNIFGQNNAETNEINCTFKGRIDDTDFISLVDSLAITKVFSVNLPNFLITGSFIITDKEITSNYGTMEIKINARNYNLNENFNDIYRLPIEQLNTDSLSNTAIVLYAQDNRTVISKEIIVNGEVVNNV